MRLKEPIETNIDYTSLAERRRRKLMLVNAMGFVANFLMVSVQIMTLGPAALVGSISSAIIAVGFAAAFFSARQKYHYVMIGRISLYIMGTAVMVEVAMSGGLAGYFGHAVVCLPIMSAFLLGAKDTVVFSVFGGVLMGALIVFNGQLPAFALSSEDLFLATSLTAVCTMAGMGMVAITLVHDTEKTDTILQQLLEQQTFLATHDPLTKLANRAGLSAELSELDPLRDEIHAYLIDLDGFKQVNDRFGHSAGDDVLVAVSERIRNFAQKARLAVRLGGDEFLVVYNVADLDGQAPDAFGDRLAKVLLMNHEADGESAFVTSSVGGASFPGDAGNLSDVLLKADKALYAAKHAGKSVYRRYAPGMESQKSQPRTKMQSRFARQHG